jgi:predicted nucleotidyltransferase
VTNCDHDQGVGSHDKVLAEAIGRIVAGFRPQRIYLFGSRAWGCPQESSDYDLLIVVEDGEDERRLTGRIQLSLWGLRAPFDIIVRTRSWWKDWSDAPCSLEERIATEGVVLHDAA